MSVQQEDTFDYIVDPATNKNVGINSAVGRQVIRNYIETLKYGGDSPNILDTKMFYDEHTPIKVAPKSEPVQHSVNNLYEYAKTLADTQFRGEDVYKLIDGQEEKKPVKGNIIWIKRSNGKWQQAIISEVSLYKKSPKFNVYFKAGDKIGTKKNLDTGDILFY